MAISLNSHSKNVDKVKDCRCGQFCLEEVYAEHGEDCAEYYQIHGRPYRQQVETMRGHRLHTIRTEQYVVRTLTVAVVRQRSQITAKSEVWSEITR